MSDASDKLPPPLQRFDAMASLLPDVLRAIDVLRDTFQTRRNGGHILPNVLEAMRIELTYNSNALEGNTLTLRETQLVIEGVVPSGGHSMREVYEARNHDRALRMIEEWVGQRSIDAQITERDVLEVHEKVLADIDAVNAGRFRSERVLIAGTGFVPPSSEKFDVLIPTMLVLANRSGLHPLVQAAELHYNLVAIHPFSDGNGRTSRLMMNYVLMRAGFPAAVIEVARRKDYLTALDEANAGRIEAFARFIGDSLVGSIGKLLGNGS
jgi:Fic family protein